MKRLSTRVHGVLDYLTAGTLLALPRLMGWSKGTTRLLTNAAAGTLGYSLLTRYELAPVKLLPMKAHLALDGASGALLAGALFLFLDEEDGVARSLVGLGLFELAAALLTETKPSRGASAGVRVEQTVTVNKPPGELYRFWRDVENLPRVMRHLRAVTPAGDRRSHWVAAAPAGARVEWDAEVTDEQEDRLIAWRSLPDAGVRNAGSVRFTPAPGGRGTEVRVTLEYEPPAGAAGKVVARLLGEAPAQQVAEDLRHFKQVMEAGEVPTTEGQPSAR